MSSFTNILAAAANATATQPEAAQDLPFNYVPTGWVGLTFLALFGATTLVHFIEAIYFRTWYMMPTLVMCGVGELIGWGGRYWGHLSPSNHDAFLMQISTTIIAPSFMTAAMFLILPKIINELGPQYSRMSPRLYSIIFIAADVSALVIQAVGGALASIADTLEGANQGSHIMLAGIIIQLVAIVLFTFLAVEFIIRYSYNRPARKSAVPEPEIFQKFQGWEVVSRGVVSMLIGLGIAIVFMVIRSVYRTIELTDGWNGTIISTEKWFNWFDGMPIVIAMATFNFFHPGYLLRETGSSLPRSMRPSEEPLELRTV
ncbi:RTA1-like protein [Ceratobasidium sp. AG-Ba]|nr:RTA1-like protein [Ceratobasidium sp. AG-Ba]QRW06396.1 RTA1-like protein [Ceratobasidium sp. AG-Ba]